MERNLTKFDFKNQSYFFLQIWEYSYCFQVSEDLLQEKGITVLLSLFFMVQCQPNFVLTQAFYRAEWTLLENSDFLQTDENSTRDLTNILGNHKQFQSKPLFKVNLFSKIFHKTEFISFKGQHIINYSFEYLHCTLASIKISASLMMMIIIIITL